MYKSATFSLNSMRICVMIKNWTNCDEYGRFALAKMLNNEIQKKSLRQP